MYKIIKKRILNPTVTMMDIYAPLVRSSFLKDEFQYLVSMMRHSY